MRTFMKRHVLMGAVVAACLLSSLSQADAGLRYRQRPVRNWTPVVTYYPTHTNYVRRVEKPGTTHVGHHTILPTDMKPTQYHPDQRLN